MDDNSQNDKASFPRDPGMLGFKSSKVGVREKEEDRVEDCWGTASKTPTLAI